MQKFAIGTATAGLLAAGAIVSGRYGGRRPQRAVRIGRRYHKSAAATWDITCRLNGTVSDALSQCIATGVHGLSNSDPTVFTTAYVDISCPSSDD